MTNRFMRIVDETLGAALCLLLLPLAGLRILLARPDPEPPRRILVIKLFGMGSLILATPVLQALRRQWPGARITILTFASNRVLAESFPEVNEVLTLRSDGLAHFAADVLRLVQTLRADLVLDLEFFTFFTALVAFRAAPRRIGFHSWRCGRSLLFTSTTPFDRHQHISRNFLNLLKPLGLGAVEPVTPTRPHFAPVDVPAHLARLGLQQPYLLLNPNASALSYERRWPLAHFRSVMERVQATHPAVQIAVIGAASERGYAENLNPPINLAGQTTLPELAVVLQESAALISNDSGPLHLASLYGTPALALFGPESPELYRPLNPNHHVFYCGDLPCSPCLNPYRAKQAPCKGRNACMQRITPDEVFQKLDELLKARGIA